MRYYEISRNDVNLYKKVFFVYYFRCKILFINMCQTNSYELFYYIIVFKSRTFEIISISQVKLSNILNSCDLYNYFANTVYISQSTIDKNSSLINNRNKDIQKASYFCF
ncbi:hypothetical protein EDEG_03280 [Edhazardia aedis USNM 41457]|uniref:Uncharacterized protein n=1 Tax=Edhazardia aedis (strain USNM 41457) TaxID=1003232 RepID=J9D404_EDHAE|nr:hypothetical protein EDEG_03280 [Edhazardia aedis USNM 41457]|eukprot:EJW02274.1 hypothetical protein EDEG_03280 [Edhazardia aedis USNM 41457]